MMDKRYHLQGPKANLEPRAPYDFLPCGFNSGRLLLIDSPGYEVALKPVLYDVVFLATCWQNWKRLRIHCKLQEKCYTLQFRAALQLAMVSINTLICCYNLQRFEKSLQLLRKVKPISTASVTRCNFLCNLCCNSVGRQVAVRDMPSVQLNCLVTFWAWNDCTK